MSSQVSEQVIDAFLADHEAGFGPEQVFADHEREIVQLMTEGNIDPQTGNAPAMFHNSLIGRCKVKGATRCYSTCARKHPIKANPAKAGDAKLWVYRHNFVTTTARPPKITK